MIAEAGHYALVLALALALIQSTLPILGARLRDPALMNVARSAALAQLLFVAASGLLALAWNYAILTPLAARRAAFARSLQEVSERLEAANPGQTQDGLVEQYAVLKSREAALAAAIAVVEDDGTRLKFNPFANASREQIEAIYRRAKLPPHPLAAMGYLSVGCMPCTSRTEPGEDARAGRWRGRPKTECGIHTTQTS